MGHPNLCGCLGEMRGVFPFGCAQGWDFLLLSSEMVVAPDKIQGFLDFARDGMDKRGARSCLRRSQSWKRGKGWGSPRWGRRGRATLQTRVPEGVSAAKVPWWAWPWRT